MKLFPIPLFILLFSSSGLFGQDLVVTLKDGSEIIGVEVKAEETPTEIKVNIRNEKGIRETIAIGKSEIRTQRAYGPHDAAFAKIKEYTPTPDLLPKAEYQTHIDGCKRFLEIYEKTATPKQAEATKKALAQLEGEFVDVKAGGLKFDGRVYRRGDLQTNRYEFDMRIALSRMQRAFDAGDYRNAMRRFDTIQRDFSNSERYEEARQLALASLNAYKGQVALMLREVDAAVKAREDSLLGIAASDRAAEQAAFDQADAAYQKRMQADRKLHPKWLLLNKFHKQPMEEVARNIQSALTSLNQPPSPNFVAVGPLYRELWAAIGGEDLPAAKELYNKLKPLRVPQRYLAEIDAKLNPPAPEPEPTGPDTPVTNPPDNGGDPKEGDPKETGSEKPKDKDRDKTADAAPASAPAADTGEEEKGFPIQIVLVVVLVVVIAGALLSAFAGKKK